MPLPAPIHAEGSDAPKGDAIHHTLAEHIYDEAADHQSNVVQYFICRLRAKLDPEGRINPIQTVCGASTVRCWRTNFTDTINPPRTS